MSKSKGYRLDSEVEHCRSYSGFKRLQELLPQITSKGSGIEFMANFLSGETALELFLDGFQDGFPKPNGGYQESLKKSKKHLLAVFDSPNVLKHVALETHLLLAKLYYVCAQYDDALTAISKAKLEHDDVQFHSLRTLRLVTESYAIKGLCLEAHPPKSTSRHQKSAREDQILVCFEKASDLALKYLQELDKVSFTNVSTNLGGGASPLYPSASSAALSSANAATVQISLSTGAVQSFVGRHEQIGPFIDTAVQRVPISYIKRRELQKGVDAYRRVLTNIDKFHTQNLQQVLSRQFSEVLLRGVTSKAYRPPNSDHVDAETPDSLNGGALPTDQTAAQSPVKFFITTESVPGYGKDCFIPNNKLEEAFLLLCISESIVCKEAVLSRADDHVDARDRSIQNVKAVQNLLTLVLSTLREYQLLSDMYERAMKFAYEDRYIWFQFALSLICQAKYTRAASVLTECINLVGSNADFDVTSFNDDDPTQCMIAAKICIEQLGRYDQGVTLALTAVKICRCGWLTSRAYLLLGLGYSLKAQASPLYSERKLLMVDALRSFEDAVRTDPKDHLAEFFFALQLAINRNVEDAKRRCKKSLAMRADQPVALMLMGLLLTAENHYADALNLVEHALEDHPTHYGLLVLRMKLEMKLLKSEGALLTAKDLLLFWRFPSFSSCPDRIRSTIPHLLNDTFSAVEHKSTDPASSTLLHATTNVAMATTNANPLTSTASSNAMLATNGIDVTDRESIMSASRPMTEYGGAVSTVSDSLGLIAGSFTHHTVMQYRMQANIWLELAELFLDGGNYLDEVQECVEEACASFPNSHQALYLKGRLHQTAGRSKDAKACYLGALGMFPNHIPSLRCLAGVYESANNLRMAEQVLREVVKIDPLDHTVWFALGNLLAKSQSHAESTECLQMAITLEESTPLMPFSVIPRVTHV